MNTMKKIISVIVAILYFQAVFAQSDVLTRYIEKAFKFSNQGDYATSEIIWDLCLKEVQETEGVECLNYFIDEVHKSEVLIEAGEYAEAEYYRLNAIKVLEESEIYEEVLAQAYESMAIFQQNCKGDYVASLKYHFKKFNLLRKLYGKEDVRVYESFDEMLWAYEASIVTLGQLGADGQFSVSNPQMSVPNLTYEHCVAILHEWRNIVNNIISNQGKPYFDELICRSDTVFREMLYHQTGQVYNTKVHGTLVENYCYEVLANICFDNIRDYFIALQSFRDNVSPNIPSYLDYVEDISLCLENKGYIQLQLSLLVEEYDIHLHNLNMYAEADALSIADRLRVEIIKTALRHGFYDVAIYHINSDLDIYKSYSDVVPEYTTADAYVDKLLTLAWGNAEIDNDYEEMFRYTKIAESVLTHNHVYMHNIIEGMVYQNKATYYYLVKKDYAAAEEYQRKAIHLSDTVKDHLKIEWPATMYKKLADICIDRNKYDEAIAILEKCVEHCQLPIFGVDKTISYIYGSLFCAYEANNQKQEMANAARNMYSTKISYFQEVSFGLRKANIVETYNSENIPIHLGLFAGKAIDNPLMVGLCYDVALSQKGFLINYDAKLFDNVHKSGNEELIVRYNDYKDAEKSQSDSLWYYEGRFLVRYAEHEEFKKCNNSAIWQDVQKLLGENDLAVEFALSYKDESNSYVALLLKKDWDSPKMIELCDESELKKIMSSGARLYKENAAAYSCIWEKLEPYFKKGDNIYFAPHGLIHQLNIEVLCGADGKPMNKKFNLYRVSSTGNLVEKRESLKYTSATLYGGLNYDTDTTSMLAINRNYVTTSSMQRGRLLDESVQTRAGWSYLPGTVEEVRNVGDILDRNKIETTTYTDEVGTEESFKALSGNSTPIIHIATHGFYLEDKNARRVEMFRTFEENKAPTISPLKRSGLMFSGGQHAWLGREIPEGIDDGVLTAEEIAGMNLSGTDLLVLSACQTGLGEITNEGVEGLQRGFKIAGVNTIIMSLCEVSDAATEVLMTKFYSLLTKGKTKREAFDSAVEAVKKEYPSPEYWAAFIMLD